MIRASAAQPQVGDESSAPHSARDTFAAVLEQVARGCDPHECPSALPAGSVLAGKFRVVRCLGMGNMGAVYEVVHLLTRHRRALKVLNPNRGLSDEVVRRFFAEASAAGRVDSPHLVETFDAGRLPGGEPYVVMELLHGISFRALLDRAGRLDPVLACELVAQAADGMRAAHAAGIVHRDLKPENLFIVRRDDKPFVKVLDFGISKFSSASVPPPEVAANVMFGTPAYMAPEQYQDASEVDARTDIFALGAVLFECLGGQPPYMAASVYAIGARLMTGASTPLDTLRPGLDPTLVRAVHSAIAADANRRIPSAWALRAALAPFRKRREPSYSGFIRRGAHSSWSSLVTAVHHTPLSDVPLPYLALAFGLVCTGGFAFVLGLAWLLSRLG